jgi:hypothetical protein
MAQETRQMERNAARGRKPRISEKLKLETDGTNRFSGLTRHPFQSALRIGVLSTAILLPIGTVNTVFAVNAQSTSNNKQTTSNVDHVFANNEEKLYSSHYGDYLRQNVVKPQQQQLDRLWNAKVMFAASKFQKQHPDSSLIEQDYGVIKAINDSLPNQRQLTAFEWYMYQTWYMTCGLGFSHAPEAMRKRNAITAAIYRTKTQYPEDFRTGAAEFYSKKPVPVAKKNVSVVKKDDSNNFTQHNKPVHDKVLVDMLFFGAIAILIWWRIKTAPAREQKEEAYLKEQKEKEWKKQREELEWLENRKRIIHLINTLPEKELKQRRFELLTGLGKAPAYVPDRLLEYLPISVQREIKKVQEEAEKSSFSSYSSNSDPRDGGGDPGGGSGAGSR